MASKPVFTPTQSSAGGGAFNPLTARSRPGIARDTNIDEDGWGQDAPPVTRTQLEKVQPSYQPTKVNLSRSDSQSPGTSPRSEDAQSHSHEDTGVVRGGYQPIGKVDIAEIRRQAQRDHSDDRPTTVKGAYEPVGKVDIAAIRARAQQPSGGSATPSAKLYHEDVGEQNTTDSISQPTRQALPDRSVPLNSSERLTSLPKPKVSSKFGSSTSSFVGTKAPTPGGGGYDSKLPSATPQSGVGRTFADRGGKTPAQIWAEKKAREGGISGASDSVPTLGSPQGSVPIVSQDSGRGNWKSGYTGKSWAPIQTTRTGQSSASVEEQQADVHAESQGADVPSSTGGVDAVREKFKQGAPIGAANVSAVPSPPVLDNTNKPNASRGVSAPKMPSRPSQAEEAEEELRLPSPPPQPPRSPTPPTPPAVTGSPIRVAMPVARSREIPSVTNAREELASPPAMPTRSLADVVPRDHELIDEASEHLTARGAGEATATASFGQSAVDIAKPGAHESGRCAVAQYDYDKAEDNEIELKEGESVFDIEMVDENWWMGRNAQGESGLFPSNYVELVQDEVYSSGAAPEPATHAIQSRTATALYDYEAAEDNELSFPENAKLGDVVSGPCPILGYCQC